MVNRPAVSSNLDGNAKDEIISEISKKVKQTLASVIAK
jgi:hypothetical protein